jgi:bacteriorhodopsin
MSTTAKMSRRTRWLWIAILVAVVLATLYLSSSTLEGRPG